MMSYSSLCSSANVIPAQKKQKSGKPEPSTKYISSAGYTFYQDYVILAVCTNNTRELQDLLIHTLHKKNNIPPLLSTSFETINKTSTDNNTTVYHVRKVVQITPRQL